MVIQHPFLHDLSTGHVHENGIVLHAVKLGGADQAASGTGEGRTDYQHVGRLQKLIEPLRCSDPAHLLIGPAMQVDGVHPHADAVHEPPGRGSDAAKPEDSADPAREHAVVRELIKLAKFEVSVLQDQALGGGKCHRQRVLSHRLGVAAAVGCHWHPRWANSAASPDRSSLEVLNVKSTPALRSASARAASSSSVRYTTSLAPARVSATIALRVSLSSKAMTRGGRLNSMHRRLPRLRSQRRAELPSKAPNQPFAECDVLR